MYEKESIPPQEFSSGEKANAYKDVKSLWDRWDQAQQEEGPSDLVRGSNLVGVGMIIAGAMFQTFASGALRDFIAPLAIVVGAVILAVKKFKALWLQRSVDR
jgi:hypothetical protein